MTDERTSLDPEREDLVLTQADTDEPLLDHNYDGIQEYDNPMPAWWTWLFVATIVWAGAYVILIETGVIPKYEQSLAAGLAEIHERQVAAAASLIDVDQAFLAALSGDAARIADGQAVYNRVCVACHAAGGAGGIGASLNDSDWIHGGTLADIYHITEVGVPAQAMPAWGNVLSQDEMINVTLYIETFGGVITPPAEDAPADAAAAEDPAPDTGDETEADGHEDGEAPEPDAEPDTDEADEADPPDEETAEG